MPGVITSIPGGSLIITDFISTPMAVLDPADGTYLGYVDTVASDAGAILPNGVMGLFDGNDGGKFVLYTNAVTELARLAAFDITVQNIASDGAHTFYVGYSHGSGLITIHTVSDAGVTGGTSWTLPNTANSFTPGFAPNQAGTILYYIGTQTDIIYRYDLVNSVALSNLAAAVSGYHPFKDLFVLSDGTILVPYRSTSVLTQNKIIRYNPDGTINQTYLTGLRGDYLQYRSRPAFDELSMWVWLENGPNNPAQPVHFIQIRLSDGAIVTTIPATEAGQQGDPALGQISNSCPLLIMPEGPPTIEVLSVSCSSGRVTITGTGFSLSATVILTGPSGTLAFTVVSQTSTEIVLQIALPVANGTYCATVVNP